MAGYELFFAGLMLSLLFVAVTGYYPGGIIVPGYLVLFVDQPWRIAGTFAAALITLLIFSLVSRHLLLFGKRRFVFLLTLGALNALLLTHFLPELVHGSLDYRVIGVVIPGLIANSFERQGVVVTTASTAIVVAATWFAGIIYYQLLL